MAIRNTPEERQIMKLIEEMPVPAEIKTAWDEQIRKFGMNQELAEEIRQKLNLDSDDEAETARLARFATEFARLVKRWQFAEQSRNFKKR